MSNIQTGLEKEPKKSLSKLQCSRVNIEILLQEELQGLASF
jgi:hypothetical protein